MKINLPDRSGVYAIRNIRTNDMYIGESVSMQIRVYGHAQLLRNSKHRNHRLQEAYNFYRGILFEAYCIEECVAENLCICEQKWLDLLQPLYNLAHTNYIHSRKVAPSTGTSSVAISNPEFHHPEKIANPFYKDDELLPRPGWHQRVYGAK